MRMPTWCCHSVTSSHHGVKWKCNKMAFFHLLSLASIALCSQSTKGYSQRGNAEEVSDVRGHQRDELEQYLVEKMMTDGLDDLFYPEANKNYNSQPIKDDDFDTPMLELLRYIADGEEMENADHQECQSDGMPEISDDVLDVNGTSDGMLGDIMEYFAVENTELDMRSYMEPNYIRVAKFLTEYQDELDFWRKKSALAQWTKATNLTKHNIDASSKVSLEYSDWAKAKRREARKFSQNDLFPVEKRMLKFVLLSSALKEKDLAKLNDKLMSRMSSIYSKAQVCKEGTGECYHFEPGLTKIMRNSRDYDELLWAWKGWRDAIGPKIRKDWIRSMKLSNLGAKENGYHDEGQYIRKRYEDPNFAEEIDALWNDIEPLYKQLHAYVRYKLHQEYGSRVPLDKPIPAHILGGMWAMKWDALLDRVQPYPAVGGFDVTKGMKKRNMTTHQMFTLADDFYRSIGLPPMPPAFWEKSMFTRPKDNRPVVCYASAHNIGCNDVRVKMCAVVSADYLYVVHHEMGHCQYYLAYNRNQPSLFRAGANNGFHEAIGDTAALSVISPSHLERIGILDRGNMAETIAKQKDLNFLMQKALAKLAFYPFALTMAKWRWDVYSGKISTDELNAAWWQYKKRYQGIMPPVVRTENDFDPGSKYHITYFVPYIRYFISHVLQFQFYESMCRLAKHEGPLHNCDFAGSKTAGKAFEKMLQMGSSKPWPEALNVLTGTTKMSVKPMIRYFAPLLKWLKAENKRLKIKIGWE